MRTPAHERWIVTTHLTLEKPPLIALAVIENWRWEIDERRILHLWGMGGKRPAIVMMTHLRTELK